LKSLAVIGYGDFCPAVVKVDSDFSAGGVGVPPDVSQGFLSDAEKRYR